MCSLVRFQRVICRFIRQVGGVVDTYSLSQRIGSEPEINNVLGLHRILLKSGVRNVVRPNSSVDLSHFLRVPLLLYTRSDFWLVYFKDKKSQLIGYNGAQKLIINTEDLEDTAYWIIPVEVAPYIKKSPIEKRRISILTAMLFFLFFFFIYSVNHFLNNISFESPLFSVLLANVVLPIVGCLICLKIIQIEDNTAEAGAFCSAFAKSKWIGCSLKSQQTTFFSFFRWSILGLSHFIAIIASYFLNSASVIEAYISIPVYLLAIIVSLYTQIVVNKLFFVYTAVF